MLCTRLFRLTAEDFSFMVPAVKHSDSGRGDTLGDRIEGKQDRLSMDKRFSDLILAAIKQKISDLHITGGVSADLPAGRFDSFRQKREMDAYGNRQDG
jgi:hypothetical protein